MECFVVSFGVAGKLTKGKCLVRVRDRGRNDSVVTPCKQLVLLSHLYYSPSP